MAVLRVERCLHRVYSMPHSGRNCQVDQLPAPLGGAQQGRKGLVHKAKLSLAVLTVIICSVAVLLLAGACGEDWPWNCTPGKEPNTESEGFRARAILDKYEDLFWRQPNIMGVGIGFLEDEDGEWMDTVGLDVVVTEKVDQSTLPPEDRIPDCLDGVPVQITEPTEDWGF